MSQITDTDYSFMDSKDPGRLTVKDILMTILYNLHWIVLCAAAGIAIAWFVSDRAERIYESHAKIKIHSLLRGETDGASMLENLSIRRISLSSTAINDEITVLTSETAMLSVTRSLGLGTSYQYKTKLVRRYKDLYNESPIDVRMIDLDETDAAKFTVTVHPDSTFTVEADDKKTYSGTLGDTVRTKFGRVAVIPTWAMRETYFDTPLFISKRSIYDVANLYRDKVVISKGNASEGIVNLSLHDTSPRRAADILNEMIAKYNESAINEKMEMIRHTSEYINARISQLDRELGAQESQIAAFKQNNRLLNVQDYGQAYLTASIESSEEVERLRSQISHAQYIQSLVVAESAGALIPVTVNVDDDNISSAIGQYNDLVLKIDKYQQSGTANNPVVKNLEADFATLKSNLNKLITTYIGAVRQKISIVEEAGRQADSKVRSIPGGQLYLDNIARVQGIKESLYLTLLGKREELMISQPSIEGNAKVIDTARVNMAPISPDSKKNMTMGFLLGLLIPFLVFFIKRIMDTRIHTRKDVEAYINDIPILGEIPSREKKDKSNIVVEGGNRSSISEAFRILRSNMDFTRKTGGGASVYMFLSLVENSGKTFIAANVAASLSLVHKKVILLDIDLRKGTLSKNWKLNHAKGLSLYLSGKSDDIEQIIQHDVIAPGVDFIPSGVIPPNPAELLSSSRLDELFGRLREKYDYILIDAVPTGIIADASLLRRVTDTSIFVLRSGLVDKRMLPDLQRMKNEGQFPGMTLLLNDVNYKKQKRGYGKGYGYGYGYGYGKSYGYGYGYGYGSGKLTEEK